MNQGFSQNTDSEPVAEVNQSSENQPLLQVYDIQLNGNKRTKDKIILRELPVSINDLLSKNQLEYLLEQGRHNLLNTSLFNFVTYRIDTLRPFTVIIHYDFVERWYIWPAPVLEFADPNVNQWIKNPSMSRLNYGIVITHNNFRGRMEQLELEASAGFSTRLNLHYSIPYINYRQKTGMIIHTGWQNLNEVPVISKDNRQIFLQYDQSSLSTRLYAGAGIVYRPEVFTSHELIFYYNHNRIDDTLMLLNPHFAASSNGVDQFLSIQYKLKIDHRELKAYPLEGYYFDIRLKRYGLSLLSNGNTGTDLSTFESSARKFWKLNKRWFFASGANVKFSAGDNQPYYLQQGIGFPGDIVRGYEKYVIDGQDFIIWKNNIKYNIIPYREDIIALIPSKSFSRIHYAMFVNLFVDLGYAKDTYYNTTNPLNNKLLTGYGIGIDLVSYYDKVLRTELSVNRLGETGLFFHFIAPI